MHEAQGTAYRRYAYVDFFIELSCTMIEYLASQIEKTRRRRVADRQALNSTTQFVLDHRIECSLHALCSFIVQVYVHLSKQFSANEATKCTVG